VGLVGWVYVCYVLDVGVFDGVYIGVWCGVVWCGVVWGFPVCLRFAPSAHRFPGAARGLPAGWVAGWLTD